jgi:xyloglucan-specific exo-beta-1,4-glucanase
MCFFCNRKAIFFKSVCVKPPFTSFLGWITLLNHRMKRTILLLSVVLIAALGIFLKNGDASQTIDPESKVPGTHPAYQEQFKLMKQNIHGEMPTDPWLQWIKADKLMKKGTDFIESISEVGPDHVGGRTRALIIDQDNPNRLYAGGVSGGLWISQNKGTSWTQVNDQAPTLSITAIVQNPFDSDEILYTVGEPTGNSAGIQTTGFFISRDRGENFTYTRPKGTQSFSSIWDVDHSKTDSHTIYTATHNQGVSISIDGGDSFYRMPTTSGKIHDIDAFSDSTVWFTRERVGVYVYDERSKTVKRLTGGLPTSGFTRVLVERSPSHPNVAYAIFAITGSSMHSVYKTSNAGQTWTKLTKPPSFYNYEWYCLTLGVHPEDTNFVVLAGQQPAYSIDGGKKWRNLSRSHADYHSLAFFKDGKDFLVGNDGGVHIYNKQTAGTKFIDINNGYSITQFYAGAFGPGPDDLVIAGTQDNGTHITRYENATFKKVYGGDGAYCAISQQSKVAYLSTQNGYIRRTDTSFRSSLAISGGLRSQAPSGDFWFINPFELNPEDGDQIYFPTERNLFLSLDRGTTWDKISNRTPSFAYSVGITRAIEPTVYLAGSTGLLWRIDTATQAQEGSHYDLRPFAPSTVKSGFIGNVEIDPIDETTIYLALNNYGAGDKIWRVEKADSDTPVFTSIAGNLPTNLPVNWIEVNNENSDEIFAATDFGLYATDDAGETWEKLTDIPNVHIPQIRLKEENGKLFVFTHGRGIFMVQLKRDNTGIEEKITVDSDALLNVYPNPTQDFLSLDGKPWSDYEVFGLNGQQYSLPETSQGIDVKSLPVGTYFIRFNFMGEYHQQRFVKF